MRRRPALGRRPVGFHYMAWVRYGRRLRDYLAYSRATGAFL